MKKMLIKYLWLILLMYELVFLEAHRTLLGILKFTTKIPFYSLDKRFFLFERNFCKKKPRYKFLFLDISL